MVLNTGLIYLRLNFFVSREVENGISAENKIQFTRLNAN